MAKSQSDSVPASFVLLRSREYQTLLTKGLLHAVPPERYLTAAQTEDYSALLQALPAGEDLLSPWLLLATTTKATPLDLSHVLLNHTYPLDEQQAQQLTEVMVNANPALQSWWQKLLEAIRRVRYITANYRHGILVVPRLGNQRPESEQFLSYTQQQYIQPSQLYQEEAWAHALPDLDDDEYALVLPLSRPLGVSPVSPAEQLSGDVIPLTKRGATLLEQHAGYKRLAGPVFARFIEPVLTRRRQVEATANATRLAQLKPAERKKLAPILADLEDAADKRRTRQSSLQAVDAHTFWDALFDYDRTGAEAEHIPDNQRGILLDLGHVARNFLKAQKQRNGPSAQDDLIRAALNGWGAMANNPSLDIKAFNVFNPKSPDGIAVNTLNIHLGNPDINVLAIGYQFLFLKRTHGHQGKDVTPVLLDQARFFAKSAKLETEFVLAIYALGLTLEASRFLDVFRATTYPSPPAAKVKAAPIPRETKNPKLPAEPGTLPEPVASSMHLTSGKPAPVPQAIGDLFGSLTSQTSADNPDSTEISQPIVLSVNPAKQTDQAG